MPRTKEHQSTAIPGATFTLLTVGRTLRHQTELKLAPQRHKGRLLLEQWRAINIDDQGLEKLIKPLTEEQLKQWMEAENAKPPSPELLTEVEKSEIARLTVEMDLANEGQRLAITEARLVSFTIPGDEWADVKTTKDLLEFGPEQFALEVEDAANADWQISPVERANLEQPISLVPVGDGQTESSTAGDAENETTTSIVVAA